MSANVNLIAAVGKRGQLGLGGVIPWRDPQDLRWFQQMTMGHVVVLGSRTWNGMREGKPIFKALPGRTKWIVSRAQLKSVHSPEYVIELHRDRQIWVAGGEYVYRLWMPFVRRCFITRVDYDGPADVWMPPLWEAREAAQ